MASGSSDAMALPKMSSSRMTVGRKEYSSPSRGPSAPGCRPGGTPGPGRRPRPSMSRCVQLVAGGEGLDLLGHLVVGAGEAGEDQRLGAVLALAAAAASRATSRSGLAHVAAPGRAAAVRAAPACGHRRAVDALAALGRDQQDHVGVAGAEAVPEQVGGLGRLGARVVEAARGQVLGHPAADDAGQRRTRRGPRSGPGGGGGRGCWPDE